ncbi:MAG: hypothetical protein Q9186_005539 [Xanthomendoza sp. 1 TL-2023]
MYLRNINFDTGNVSEWIERQMPMRGLKPFLSHVLLDLPSSHTHVEKAVSALRVDGKLLVFNPSITQINSTIERIKSTKLQLQLEKVVEVGLGMTGGRMWDVRFVRPRALAKEIRERATAVKDPDNEQAIGDGGWMDAGGADGSGDDDEGLEIICRPKVGDKIRGGGFIALWSKNKTRNDL